MLSRMAAQAKPAYEPRPPPCSVETSLNMIRRAVQSGQIQPLPSVRRTLRHLEEQAEKQWEALAFDEGSRWPVPSA